MSNLCLPERVTVRLVTRSGEPYQCADILVGVRAIARRKNDFYLGPYPTNADGVSTFTKADLQADVEATYDSGLMDYCHITDCQPFVEIKLWSLDEISKAITARTETWTSLLKGEKVRWRSIDELVAVFRRALLATRPISGSSEPHIRGEWNDSAAQYDYVIYVETKTAT